MLNKKFDLLNAHDEIMNSALRRMKNLIEAHENALILKFFYSGITNSCCKFTYQLEVIVVI